MIGVDSGAPEDVRKALVEGASWWNQAFEAAGWRIDHSEAGLYLWVTRGRDCWAEVAELGRDLAPPQHRQPLLAGHEGLAIERRPDGAVAALLGYFGGMLFKDRPILALLVAFGIAASVTAAVEGWRRFRR